MELAIVNDIQSDSNTQLNTTNNSQLIVLYDGNIHFIGKVSKKNKLKIYNALITNEFFELESGLFRIVFEKNIFLFNKYDLSGTILLVGITVDKTDETRLKLLDKQTDYLLQKIGRW